ncbi:YjjG family noncanonical pyrimidine nucleotidase [Winogradskyella sp. 3972H.M.0a.05]|uniref:YjjG family noncanonical pyrimidine nucleotidase n=1 Tax=Winogradskyella sp. 3972H.M.0a.05 TaxID=2950277 RepID=UPI0033936A04
MKLKKVKHVFFDLDHTLWDFDKNSALAFEKIFQLHDLKINLDDFLGAYEPINLDYWKLYREERIKKPELRYGRLKDSFDSINHEISDTIINQLSEDYITHLTTFNHLFDNTMYILEYLKANYELHIITNGFEEAQQKKMNTSGISTYFKTVTNSEQAGVKKPNPYIFDFALKSANAKNDESVMIGDNLEADVQGALNIGMDAIFFNYRKEHLKEDIKQVNELIELKKYL